MKRKKFFLCMVFGLLFLSIIVAFIYLVTRIVLFVEDTKLTWYEDLSAIILLLAETFIIIHGIGYFSEILKVLFTYETLKDQREEVKELETYPLVDILIPSYNEPISVLKETLICTFNLTYKNKRVFLLDDTRYDQNPSKELLEYRDQIDELCQSLKANVFRRKWRGAKAGIINDFLDFVQGRDKDGFSLVSYQEKEETFSKPDYVVVFDADQNPFYDFLEPLIYEMEQNKKIAFIQTPQHYTNFESNRVARASSLQQVVFYEYICVGKSVKNAMFCCGTNVAFRVEALIDVGGFDEGSVTEDFSTSLKFHLKGWTTKYHSKVSAFGLGPEDLGNYFKQQYRWAFGTIECFKKIVFEFIKNPKQLPMVVWWEYFLSGTHYFIGFVYFILIIMPIIYLFLGVPSYFASPEIYAIVFIPYFVMTVVAFFWTLRRRNYKIKDLILGQFLMLISFPIYMRAAVNAILGRKAKFEVTSKEGSGATPLKALWPQLAVGLLCFMAVVWGLNKLYYERLLILALLINMWWTFYNFLVLSTVFYFNNPKEEKKKTIYVKEKA